MAKRIIAVIVILISFKLTTFPNASFWIGAIGSTAGLAAVYALSNTVWRRPAHRAVWWLGSVLGTTVGIFALAGFKWHDQLLTLGLYDGTLYVGMIDLALYAHNGKPYASRRKSNTAKVGIESV